MELIIKAKVPVVVIFKTDYCKRKYGEYYKTLISM